MRNIVALVATSLLLWVVAGNLVRAQDAPAARFSLFLPLMRTSSGCALNAEEQGVADHLRAHPDQRRATMRCDARLAAVARAKAVDMAVRGYFGHVTPEGKGANTLVREAGYVLPAYYDSSLAGNNVESIAGGFQTVDDVMAGWLASDAHRGHLLGLHDFFAGQIDYGIGYAYLDDSPYEHYWVVITAEAGP